MASLEKQRNKRNKANNRTVAKITTKDSDYDDKYLVPALPFHEENHEAMEQGQSSKNGAEFRLLINNGPERRR